MTNEELINSNADNLINELYLQNKGLIYKLCYSFYNMHSNRCHACGVCLDDLYSEAFFVLPEAVQAYKNHKEYKFTSYLKYPLKNHFNKLIGYRVKSIYKEPLNNYKSLDMPLNDNAEDTFGDMVADPNAATPETITDDIYYSGVMPVIKNILDEKEYDIICREYIKQEPLKKIGQAYNCEGEYIRQLRNNSFRKLRNSKALKDYVIDISYMSIHKSGISYFRNSGGTTSMQYRNYRTL